MPLTTRVSVRLAFWLVALVLALAAPQAVAQARASEPGAGPWSQGQHAKLRLVAATQGVPDHADRLRLGLEFQLDPGWKIYWRNPGAAGLPPSPDWTGSDNLAGATIGWPAPTRFSTFGIESFGYEGHVVLPIEVLLQRPGEAANLAARVEFLICSDVCVPDEAQVALRLGAGEGGRGQDHAIEAARGRIPRDAADAGVTLEAQAMADRLVVTARSTVPFQSPDLALEPDATWPEAAELPKPRIDLAEGGRLARFTFHPADGMPASLPPRLALALWDAGFAVEGAAPVSQAPTVGLGSLTAALGAALLGGLILNLMPCVLPVLAMKLMPLLGLAGADARQRRRGLLASAAGIIVSMLLLGGVLALVKELGGLVGWGVQFQEPWFVALMASATFLFALNLWGLLPIGTPRLAGRAAELAPRRGVLGDFATGFLATALATPCSAPFVGTAAGFALARGPVEILLVFAALGLGLALPWLLVAARPSLVARLPRPGAWMERVRFGLGFLLAATTAWLLFVLLGVGGTMPLLLVTGVLGVAFGLLVVLQRAAMPIRTGIAAGALGLAVLLPSVVPQEFGPREAGAALARSWEPWQPGLAQRMAAEGRTVLVDITADWCVTCRVNKALVLEASAVAGLVAEGRVTAMQADWTRPDPRISAFLASHGRYGIPFNAVYGPGAPEGIVLPELLTEATVLRAIERASAPRVAAGAR